jgi:hypothetical protein
VARRSPQTHAKREREQAKFDKRQRKQEKKAAAAEARLAQQTALATDPESEDAEPGAAQAAAPTPLREAQALLPEMA